MAERSTASNRSDPPANVRIVAIRNPGFAVVVGDVTRVVDAEVLTGRDVEATDTTVLDADTSRNADAPVLDGDTTDTTVLDGDTPRTTDTTVLDGDTTDTPRNADATVLDGDTTDTPRNADIPRNADTTVLDGVSSLADGCREPAGRSLAIDPMRAIERAATAAIRVTLSLTLPHSGRTALQATARRAVRRATSTRSDKVRWSVGASAL